MRQLLLHRPNININKNPLIGACKGTYPIGNYIETLNLLVNEFPELTDQSNGDGNTPLMIALLNRRRPQLAQILLDANADVDVSNQMDDHIFSYAIHCGDTQLINNILARFDYPAHISARCGYLSYLEQHDRLGCVDDCGNTVFHNAVYGEQKELVEWFITQKHDLNFRNEAGYTPLHYATDLHYPDILEILLKAGSNPNIKDNHG